MLYRHKRSPNWRTYFEHGGQSYDISTGESNRGKAEEKATALHDEVVRAVGPGGRVQGIALEALQALDLKRAADAGVTSRTLPDKWKPLITHFGSRQDGMALTEADVGTYVGARRAAGIRGQTIRKEVQALRRGFTRAERDGLISHCPIRWHLLDKIKSDPLSPQRKSKRWSGAEIDKVLAKLSAKAVTLGLRDACQLVRLTGLRREELARYDRATWLRGNVLTVSAEDAKTGETGERRITLSKDALEIAERHARFSTAKVDKALRVASIRAGFAEGEIEDGGVRVTGGRVLTLRDLRAHFITQVAKMDLMAAQRLAGHTDISTTSRYLHPDEERIRSASLAASRIPTRAKRRGDTRKQKKQKA